VRRDHSARHHGAASGSKWGVAGAITAASAAALAATALVVRQEARRAERENPPTGKFVTVDGVRLHFIDTGGSGPAVVLLHGNGAMIADMEISGLVDRAARNYRVIAFDRPGYGYSERPRDRLWTPVAQARLFRHALALLGIERPIIVGHSWGNLVALALGLDFPRDVSGLVLVSGYYFPSVRADALLFGPPAIPGVGDVMRYTVSPVIGHAIAPKMIRKMFAPMPVTPRFDAEFPVELTLRPSQIRASSEETALMIPAAAALENRYRDLRMPVIILAGAEDEIVDTNDQSVRLHSAITQSELKVLPGLGHMLHHFAADQVVAAIDRVSSRTKA
jgi:pimeloyl-ACP methyl ester carboxylesterase